MKTIFAINTLALIAIISSTSGSSLPSQTNLDQAIKQLFSNIRDIKELQQYLTEFKTDATSQFVLGKLTAIANQLQPGEIKAMKHLMSNIGEVNPTILAQPSKFLLHSSDVNELVDFNHLLVTILELIKNDQAVQHLFEELSSPVYSQMYSRIFALPESQDLIAHYGVNGDMISETMENLFNWNLSGTPKQMVYSTPLERVTSMLYPMMDCSNCPSCTACLHCCTLRNYMLKVPKA